MHTLLTMSATEMAEEIREGRLSSRDAVDVHIARIQEVNPALNAIVADRFEEARAEADAADKRRGDADLPPLHGVPCSIKECFALTGMPNCSGLVARRDYRADSDATAVARLRAAGAIPLGVTNLSELCMWMESNNRVYGRTNNPYDHSRLVGGSSGGEGAIIGAGGTPFGLGSDIGGSIRMPAFFNGVFGHKPSGGLVPGSGQFPNSEGAALRYLTTGPLSRKAGDLSLLLRVLAGPDGIDGGCEAMTLGDPSTVDVRGLRVISVEGNGVRRVRRDLRDAQRRAARELEKRGAIVEVREIPEMKRSLELWSGMLGASEGESFATMLANGGSFKGMRELAKWSIRRSDHTLPAIVLALIEGPLGGGRSDVDAIIREGHELRDKLNAIIGDGVMLYPSYTRPAPKHGHPLLTLIDWLYTAVINVMELPVTQTPLGLNHEGLPLGVQVVGSHGNDHVTIAVAQALEEACGGWVPPWEA